MTNKQTNLFFFSLLFCITMHGAEDASRATLEHDSEHVVKCFWSVDNSRLQTMTRKGTIRNWNVETGQQIGEPILGEKEHHALGEEYHITAHPTDQHTIAHASNKTVYVRDTRTRFSYPILETERPIRDLCYDPSGAFLATSSVEGIKIYNCLKTDDDPVARKGRYAQAFNWRKGHLTYISDHKVYSIEDPLGALEKDPSVLCRNDDQHDALALAPLPEPNDYPYVFAISNGFRNKASEATISVVDFGSLLVPHYVKYETCTTGLLALLHAPLCGVGHSIDWSHLNGCSVLATGTSSDPSYRLGHVAVWFPGTTNDQHKSIRLLGHQDTVKDVAFSGDGRLLASGSKDGTVKIWKTPELMTASTSLLAAAFPGESDDE